MQAVSTYVSLEGVSVTSSSSCKTFLTNDDTRGSTSALTLKGPNYSYVIIYTVYYTNNYTNWGIIFHLDDTGYSYFLNWINSTNYGELYFEARFYFR